MRLKNLSELHSFLSTYFPDGDPEADEQATLAFVAKSSSETQQKVLAQGRTLLSAPELSLEELGTEANRWFGDLEEARAWLGRILSVIENSSKASSHAMDTVVVKDCNGTPLSEGDSVCVIKDLKVKGGSSDLKRGTIVRKIHLMGDPEAIECRVDGSTLVLKTCFLRKS